MDFETIWEKYEADLRPKTLIDIRSEESFREGSHPDAVNVFHEDIESGKAQLPASDPVYLMCRTGRTSDELAEILAPLGREVYSIRGGYTSWKRYLLTGSYE